MHIPVEQISEKWTREAAMGAVPLPLPSFIIHPYANQYVVVRTYASGVHIGYLKSYDPQTRHIFLTEARRIWRWEGAFTLSEVSQHGIKDGKISMALPEIMISDVLEIIKCSEEGAKNLKEQPAYVPS